MLSIQPHSSSSTFTFYNKGSTWQMCIPASRITDNKKVVFLPDQRIKTQSQMD